MDHPVLPPKSMFNEELARVALDCLEELEHRGNRQLGDARRAVASFHNDILVLEAKAATLTKLNSED